MNITDETFDKAMRSTDKPVLLYFSAPWCVSCKKMAIVVADLEKTTDSICIYKINVDEAPILVERFRIMSVPTFIAFKNGILFYKTEGPTTKNRLLMMLGIAQENK